METAEFGRLLGVEESELKNLYLTSLGDNMIQKRKSNPQRSNILDRLSEPEKLELEKAEAGIHRAYKRAERKICARFIHAVKTFDAETIIRIANGVMFFKGKFGSGFKDADPKRASLMLLKWKLNKANRTMPLRHVARFVNGGKPVETPADGFSSLRRLCKELGVPITPEKANKAKKARSKS